MFEGTASEAKHYQKAKLQPIEVMQLYLTPEQFIGVLRGNAIKYLLRMGEKDAPTKEAEKALQYCTWLVKALNGETIDPWDRKKVDTLEAAPSIDCRSCDRSLCWGSAGTPEVCKTCENYSNFIRKSGANNA